MKTSHVVLGSILLALSWAGPARAGYLYQYAFDQSSYSVGAGGRVNVQVYLVETVSDGSASRLASDGLIGAGVRVQFDVAPVPGSPAQVLATTDIHPNSAAFDGAGLTTVDLVPGHSAGFSESVDILSPPVLGTQIAPNTFRVLLGSFEIAAGSVAGQVTNLVATDFATTTTDTVTGAGLALDPLIQPNSATVAVAAVPEPASLTLLGTALGGALVLGQRRRQSRSVG